MTPLPQRRVILVRHGQTDYNAAGRMQGQLDTDLSAHGRAQAHSVAEAITDWTVAAVYSSDLRRAVDTATILAASWPGVEVHTDPRLRETDIGRWQGATHADIDDAYPGQRAYWKHDPTWAPPGGESRLDVARRAHAAIRDILEDCAEAEGDIVIVAHGGTIGAVTASLLELPESHSLMFSGLGNVCWSQLLLRPRAHFVVEAPTAAAVDGTTVPRVTHAGEAGAMPASAREWGAWYRDAHWHLEGWNVTAGMLVDASGPNPDEGGVPE